MSVLDWGDLEIYWDGHSTVRVEDEDFCLIVDPFRIRDGIKANVILITHPDAGHFDIESIKKCSDAGTCVVIPETMDNDLVECEDIETMAEGELIDVYGVEIESVPMYNDHHSRGEGIGYRFSMASTSIYVAGDTGLISEADDLEGRVNVAFLPVEGVYTMNVEEAVKMAVRIKPDIMVPYHYGPPFFEDEEVDLNFLKTELEDRNIRCSLMD